VHGFSGSRKEQREALDENRKDMIMSAQVYSECETDSFVIFWKLPDEWLVENFSRNNYNALKMKIYIWLANSKSPLLCEEDNKVIMLQTLVAPDLIINKTAS
jgi:hypothetical protein